MVAPCYSFSFAPVMWLGGGPWHARVDCAACASADGHNLGHGVADGAVGGMAGGMVGGMVGE